MRFAKQLVAGAVGVVVVVCAVPRTALADEDGRREVWTTLGIDTTFMGASEKGRGDLSYNILTTPRAHFGLGPHASLSMGIGLPMLQLLLLGAAASGSRSGSKDMVDVALVGIGVTTPIELRFTPQRRSKDGFMINVGASPVLDTAILCALGGECPGNKAPALVIGYAATTGIGWQWKNGSFFSVAYSAGHKWPGGTARGVDAIEGMYYGGMLSFGVSLGR